MKKDEYLRKLNIYLSRIPHEEREEILRDQEEIFREGLRRGRTEEEIVASLGSPRALANNVIAESHVQRMESADNLRGVFGVMIAATVALLALAPFNLIFVLGPVIAVFALLATGWGLGAAIIGAAFAVLGWIFSHGFFWGLGGMIFMIVGFFLLGLFGLGTFFMCLMFYFTRAVMRVLISYFRWNLTMLKRISGTQGELR
ncbi:MAG: DUF1700 domain-containing protein [Bdellovibrionales bacterium]|nr:DUF1700 domain-containing protein [Bdellovibrionales bacterium]